MLLCLPILTMILSAPCLSQNATATRLPDGSLRVEFEGKSYRGLTGAQLDQWEVQSNTLKTCQENEARYILKVESAEKSVVIAQQQTTIEHGNFVRVMQLYEKERELRTEVMSQTFAHGKVGGFGGWLLKAIDSPYFQFAVRVAAPIKTLVTK